METKSVLILDDDIDIINLLKIEFKRIGYDVHEALTSEEAIKILNEKHLDAAVIDIVLGPNETSDSVIYHLKTHHNPDLRTLPVIITSAHINNEFAAKIESKWDNVYKAEAKPFRPGQISALVSQMLLDIESHRFVIVDNYEEEEETKEPSIQTIADGKVTLSDLDTTLVHKEQVDAQNKANAENMARDDINFRNNEGETSLMIFSRKGDVTTVANLLKLGADVNLTSPRGQTALHFASRHGHYAILKMLLENGAKINVKDQSNKEPIFEAICSGNYQSVDLLIRLGARLDVKVEGLTYLMWAMEMNHPSIFNRLLAAGVNPRVRSDKGKDIKQIAKAKGLNDYLKVLSSLGL